MKNYKYGFAPNPGFQGKPMTSMIALNPLRSGFVVISCQIDGCTGKINWPTADQIKQALLIKHLVENRGVK